MAEPRASAAAYSAQLLEADDPALDELRADPRVEFIDQLEGQLANLRALRPTPDADLLAEPRRWAYYPWRRAVVAVLGPKAFRALRLDRNRNNISAPEQNRLGALRIGVAGLSVGHVIAHTVVAQGMCGHLKLADFDSLELSNLNRIPATVFDLGVNKVHVAGRRIAELDPYLPVEAFEAGVTPDSIDDFLDGLDILVEECDTFEAKAKLRQGARLRRIPVLMATSDRGLVDVERFDSEPDRPIMHGLLGELDIGSLPDMSNSEKVRHVLRYLEADRLSPRFAASLIEVDHSLSTWPQLASDVVFGAAVLTEAVRRIGLGEELRSGRARIDFGASLSQLAEPGVANPGQPDGDDPLRPTPSLSRSPQPDGDDPLRPTPSLSRSPQEPASVHGRIAAAALRAPSGGNAQPWQVLATPTEITIDIAVPEKVTMDVAYRGSAVAVGAALFNTQVAAAASHVLGDVRFTERAEGTPLRGVLSLADGTEPRLADLYQAMLARETNRHHGAAEPLAPATVAALEAAVRGQGAALHLITERDRIARAAAILAASDRIRYLTPRLHREMISELRWPGDEDPDIGIDVRSLELDAGDTTILGLLRRPDVMALLAEWDAGSALEEDTYDRVQAGSALAVTTVPGKSLRDYAIGGMAVELLWILAQQHGLSAQPISPVFLYAHDAADFAALSPPFADELEALHHDFRRLAELESTESIALVLRFATAPPTSVLSRRSSGRMLVR